jgi:hypothetical protein
MYETKDVTVYWSSKEGSGFFYIRTNLKTSDFPFGLSFSNKFNSDEEHLANEFADKVQNYLDAFKSIKKDSV